MQSGRDRPSGAAMRGRFATCHLRGEDRAGLVERASARSERCGGTCQGSRLSECVRRDLRGGLGAVWRLFPARNGLKPVLRRKPPAADLSGLQDTYRVCRTRSAAWARSGISRLLAISVIFSALQPLTLLDAASLRSTNHGRSNWGSFVVALVPKLNLGTHLSAKLSFA